ncbi:MAG: guanylate kinase [Deltaproteobacteria bacterium]|nr:guanylate kinase [Deltaproteobacteria bacterium]MBW1952224.1 guanylate kinase [Deltaproteobacteria bacterium]MBW1985823.1 guanylate kinase [Deltaproteobacteria bacterium]MBW2133859.1 guanylate kinase [Deltaproteobacteria bacterium]
MGGQIFVVSGSSGTGKTSLLQEVLAKDSRLRFSVSYTTRKPRPHEVHGQDYFFVSPDEFHRLVQQGRLIEWVEQFGHFYGTSKDWVDQALTQEQDIVFDIEIHGARQLKRLYPDETFIFILPPSLAELERRLRRRGDVPEAELQQRLQQARKELQEVEWYDYLVINDDFSEAVYLLQALVNASRCRTPLVWPKIKHRFQIQS